MTDKEKIKVLKTAFEDTIWMSIRYANGSHTYSPSMVRDAIKKFKSVFPDWKPKHDITISQPKESDIGGMSFKEDFLYDLFEK